MGVADQPGRWHSLELEARVRCGRGVRVGQIQALLDLGLAGDFLPKSLVPQGGQLWTSPAAVPGTLK